MKTRIPQKSLLNGLTGLAVAYASMVSPNVQAEEHSDLFNTLSGVRRDGVGNAEGATTTGRYLAQEFTTDDFGIVSSACLHLEILTNGISKAASGLLRVEIWDDKDGRPGSKVGSLGEVQISDVERTSQGGSEVTLEGPIAGLKPNSIHYVVLDYLDSKAFIERAGGPGTQPTEWASVWWAVVGTSGNDGDPAPFLFATFDTIEDPATLDGVYTLPPEDPYPYTWDTLILPGGNNASFMMKVTASPEDIPTPEISDLQLSDDGISLTWNSVSNISYIVEFSENLEEGSWVELADDIESGGTETVFVDQDSARVAEKSGFYRVRLNH